MHALEVRCPHCHVHLHFHRSADEGAGAAAVRLRCAGCDAIFRAVPNAPPEPDLAVPRASFPRPATPPVEAPAVDLASQRQLVRPPEPGTVARRGGLAGADRRGRRPRHRRRQSWLLLATAVLTLGALLYSGLQLATPDGRLFGFQLPGWALDGLGLRSAGGSGDDVAAGVVAYRPRVPVVAGRPSLALVGFENRSGDSDADWLAAALAGMFGDDLDALPPLRLIPGTEIARMRRDLALTDLARPPLVPIAHRLGANLIALGTYRLPQPLAVDFRLAVLDPTDGSLLADTEFEAVPITELAATVAAGSWELYGELQRRLRQDGGEPALPLIERPAVWPVDGLWPRTVAGLRLYSQGLDRQLLLDLRSAEVFLRQSATDEADRAAATLRWSAVLSELGYRDRALDAAQRAWQLTADLPEPLRWPAEAHFRRLQGARGSAAEPSPPAVQVQEELWRLDADAPEPGLALLRLHVEAGRAGSAAAVLTRLRTLPEPVRGDPRIELATAEVAALRGASGDRLQAARRAARRAEELGALTFWGLARLQESQALLAEQDAAAALAAAEAALDLLRRVDDDAGAAQAHHALAVAGYALQRFDEAEQHYQSALMTLRRLGDRDAQAQVYLHRGRLLSRLGRQLEAAEDFRLAVEIFREADDRDGQAGAHVERAFLFQAAGELAETERALRQALELYQELQDRPAELETLLAVAEAVAARERLQQAADLYQQVRQRTEGTAVSRLLRVRAGGLEHLALLARLQGDAGAATDLLRGALEIYRQLGDTRGDVRCRLTLVRLDTDRGRWPAAEASLQQLLGPFADGAVQDDRLQARVYALLAHSQLYQGNTDAARQALEAARALVPAPLPAAASGSVARKPAALPLGNGLELTPELDLALTDARLSAAEGRAPFALAELERLQQELLEQRRIGDELEVRLAQGEVELLGSTPAAGRARLSGLQQDARNRGYATLADRAAAALRRPLPRSAP